MHCLIFKVPYKVRVRVSNVLSPTYFLQCTKSAFHRSRSVCWVMRMSFLFNKVFFHQNSSQHWIKWHLYQFERHINTNRFRRRIIIYMTMDQGWIFPNEGEFALWTRYVSNMLFFQIAHNVKFQNSVSPPRPRPRPPPHPHPNVLYDKEECN